MDHGYFQDRLSAYHDGELTPEERKVLAEHLAECPECRRRLEELSRFDKLVVEQSGLGESDYWESAARRIDERVREAAPVQDEGDRTIPVRSSGSWWKVAALAASIVLVGYVGLYRHEILDEFTTGTANEGKKEQTVQPSAPQVSEAGATEKAEAKPAEPQAPSNERKAVADEALPEERKADNVGIPAPVEEPSETQKAQFKHEETASAGSPAPAKGSPAPGAESVEQMLAAVKGVQTTARGEAFIRNGKAGSDSALLRWRALRDSLTVAVAREPGIAEGTGVLQKASMKQLSKPRTALAEESPAVSQERAKKEAGERLLEAWYKICLLSNDSTEVARGRAYLDSVAGDPESPNRDMVKAYIDSLKMR